MRLSRRAAMILITASVATSAPYAKAALFTWTNASGGNQDDYTAKQAWGVSGPPTSTDSVKFTSSNPSTAIKNVPSTAAVNAEFSGGTYGFTSAFNVTGDLKLSGGTLSGGNGNYSAATLTMTGGGSASGTTITVTGTGLISKTGTASTTLGSLNLSGNTHTIDVASGSTSPELTIAGGISNGGITKTGTGTLALNNTTSYTGNTTISGGALQLGASGTLGGTVLINLNGGSLDVSAKSSFSLTSSQTLQGQGTFKTASSTTLNGIVQVGQTHNAAGSAQTLSISSGNLGFASTSTLKFDLFSLAGSVDQIDGGSSGALTYGNAILSIANPNNLTFAAGNSFSLFPNFASRTGSLTVNAANLPTLGSGLQWNFAPSTGVLSVQSTISATTYSLSASVTNLNLLKGGTTGITTTVTNTGGSGADGLSFAGLAGSVDANATLSGGSITSAGTGGPVPNNNGMRSNTGQMLTGTGYGTAHLTPVITTPTNATIGGAATGPVPTAVSINVGNATPAMGNAIHDHATLGTALTAGVSAGNAYGTLSSIETNGLGSEATLVGGTASTATSVAMAWRTRNTDEVLPLTNPNPLQGMAYLISDVVQVTGLHGDTVIVKVSYNPALLPDPSGALASGFIRLMYLDPKSNGYDTGAGTVDDAWKFATDGIAGGAFAYKGNKTPSLGQDGLGSFGVDTSGATPYAWAVVNRDGQYAVVPEPASLGVLALGATALLTRRRR